ncbi:glycosyltransferase [Paenibacillus massiliensis]|uniref:glycosyltransferase n=1 Tax=Paenibacillus massiliensis TaxID=225917 RepID=UPI00042674CB|nr:glycosyltransferase [Paenibacillus massiliensis]
MSEQQPFYLWKQVEGEGEHDRFGSRILAGDINGDGQEEWIIAASTATYVEDKNGVNPIPYPFSGRVYVYTRDMELLYTLEGNNNGDCFGAALALGDLNGDGVPEIVVASPRASSLTCVECGEIRVFSGVSGELLYRWQGMEDYARLGSQLAILDWDGDGVPEVAVSSHQTDMYGTEQDGMVTVYKQDGKQILARFMGNAREGLGLSLAAGDVNGDGRDELIIGAPHYHADGMTRSGRVMICAPNGVLGEWRGSRAYDEGGSRVAVQDVDGDGIPDILIGSPNASRKYQRGGLVTVYSVALQRELLQKEGTFASQQLGTFVGSGLSGQKQWLIGSRAGLTYVLDSSGQVLHELEGVEHELFGHSLCVLDAGLGRSRLAIGALSGLNRQHWMSGCVYIFNQEGKARDATSSVKSSNSSHSPGTSESSQSAPTTPTTPSVEFTNSNDSSEPTGLTYSTETALPTELAASSASSASSESTANAFNKTNETIASTTPTTPTTPTTSSASNELIQATESSSSHSLDQIDSAKQSEAPANVPDRTMPSPTIVDSTSGTHLSSALIAKGHPTYIRSLRILIVTYWYLPHVGGVDVYVRLLKKELEQQGHTVDVLAHHPDMAHYYLTDGSHIEDKWPIKEVVYERLMPLYQKYLPHIQPWVRYREIERYCFELAASLFNLKQYDLIHTQDIISTRALSRVKPASTALVSTIHGLLAKEHVYAGDITSKESLAWKYVADEEYYGCTSADATIVPTEWLVREMGQFAVPPESLCVLPYGMDIAGFLKRTKEVPVLTQAEFQQGVPIISCPARLVPVKGHRVLLGALRLLAAEHKLPWRCWLIGDGVLREEISVMIAEYQLQERVVLLGDRSDVPALLRQSDLMVLPSLQDNLPFSIMEAQLAGTAIVASDTGGIPEMIKHGVTGHIVETGNERQLAAALQLLLTGHEYRQQLAEQARIWAEKHWSSTTLMNRTLQVYQAAIDSVKGAAQE